MKDYVFKRYMHYFADYDADTHDDPKIHPGMDKKILSESYVHITGLTNTPKNYEALIVAMKHLN